MSADGRDKANHAALCIQQGPLLGGEQLRLALGFKSGEAFRAAARSGRVPVQLMKIAGRKGWFARTDDVLFWLRTLSYPSGTQPPQNK